MQDYSYFNSIIDCSKPLNKIFKLPIQSESELKKFLDFDKDQFYGSNHSLFRLNKKISSLKIKEKLIKNKLIPVQEKGNRYNLLHHHHKNYLDPVGSVVHFWQNVQEDLD